MGFFSRVKTDFSYSLLRTFVENASKDLAKRDPNMERFDMFRQIWPEAAVRVGASKMIADGDQYVKFAAAFANPQSSISFTTQWLAMGTLLGFSKTRFMKELRDGLMAYEIHIRRDQGVVMSSHFAQLNPKGYLYYVGKYKREPFTDEDAQMLADVQRVSHTLE
jgi:hypothetical protein